MPWESNSYWYYLLSAQAQTVVASTPPLNMKNISENTLKKLNILLKHLETHGMEREEMASFIGMQYKNFCKYATYLRKTKQIYICGYKGNTVLYMAGNKPDVKRPPATENAQRIKEYREARKKERVYKFTPRMDVAASWMFNPC